MAKRVNHINYKGIAHTPSLVSDNDGVASECVNLAPDNGDLKPMPLPVKMSNTYQVDDDSKIVFVHKGVGYDNFMELYSITGDENTKLYLKDSDGKFLYGYIDNGTTYKYWTNGSEIVAVQSIGDTLVVSTKAGTEYLVYRSGIAPSASGEEFSTSSYKHIGQKPPMPVIEFQMYDDDNTMFDGQMELMNGEDPYKLYPYHAGQSDERYYITEETANDFANYFKSIITKIEKRMRKSKKFYKPFLIRYAIRMKTGDYIMHSPPVLMLPNGLKCPLATYVYAISGPGGITVQKLVAETHVSKLRYKVHGNADFGDWSEIVSGVDVFISDPIDNYNYDDFIGGTWNNGVYIIEKDFQAHSFGRRYVNGAIEYTRFYASSDYTDTALFTVNEYSESQIRQKIVETSLFHRILSFDFDDVSTDMDNYAELPIDDLDNLANLPTLPDDYNSHNAVSPTLMQTYNNRLNMANISQEVFGGFENAYQPQSIHIHGTDVLHYYKYLFSDVAFRVTVDAAYFRIKKNGMTYTVKNYPTTQAEKLDYCTYLYYPDEDCYEVVVSFSIAYDTSGATIVSLYLPIPMKRHEYMNGAYWYSDMACLGEYVKDNYIEHTIDSPGTSDDLWYDLPNRFMMSAVGNPWYSPVENMFDIGVGDIRALSVNAENMDAPQFGQNPIYVFSADGIYAININADGTYNKLSYVSGDVVSEPQGLGTSPTASAEQLTFFKTEKGIMMMSGSSLKEIDLHMRGRVFNPKVKLLPANSVLNGIPASGATSPLSDIINATCDGVPYATFIAGCNLVYDRIYKRLMLYNSAYPYMYVYDVRYDFWSKMFPTTAVDGAYVQQEQQETRDTTPATPTPTYTVFTSLAMDGTKIVVQDSDGYVWYMGGQGDENTISTRHLGFYVSKPIRFGTDDYKTLSNVVHNMQLTTSSVGSTDSVKMALYGSRDGQNYWRMGTLKGTSYKFFIIVLYTSMLPSSRYAYTAFEWEPRLTNKIR